MKLYAPALLLLPKASAFHTGRPSFVIQTNTNSALRQVEVPAIRVFALQSSPVSIEKDDQITHTAERLAGLSRAEVKHIFDDLDADGNGSLDPEELDLLSGYFGEEKWDAETKNKLIEDMDTDGNGEIDAEEFYQWMVMNSTASTTDGEGNKALSRRQDRLQLADTTVPDHLKALLDELAVDGVEQKVTHPLHSAFGRTLYDHFLSCYVLAKIWGNPQPVCDASIFHALYQRGDGMRAVDFTEFRPKLQEKLGKDVEELIYLFPSAHKSALLPNGLLNGDVGGDLVIPNVLEGGMVTIPEQLRPALVELEVINSHDQNILENCNPVHNLWSFYNHVTAIPYMTEQCKETIIEFKKRAFTAKVADIVEWHEGRFKNSGKEIPEVWDKHLDMFRPGGKYACAEEQLIEFGDQDGDGEIDWEEFNGFDWEQCFIDYTKLDNNA